MSYKYRKDNRTAKQFAEDIRKHTKKEQFLIRIFQEEMKHRGTPIRISDNGVDNSGKVIKGKVTACADYKIKFKGNDSILVDVKNSPIHNKMTFKVHNLKKYIRDGVYMLVFYNTGRLKENPEHMSDHSNWCIITPKAMEDMLKFCEVQKVKAFGNKDCVIIEEEIFSAFFKEERFTMWD